jgi:thiazolylpeptide-type bacteriocin precursor
MPLTAFADLELPELDLADIEVVTIRDALAVPDTGATSGSSSCKSCSTCGSSSCCSAEN